MDNKINDDLPPLALPLTLKQYSSIFDSSFLAVDDWDCIFTNEITWTKEGDGCQRVNEYRLKEEIGSGSFAQVRICEREFESETRMFAVKIMSKPRLRKIAEYVSSSGRLRKITAEQKVRREIEIMRRLYHRNVVLLFEVIESDDEEIDNHILMVLELMKGPTMRCLSAEGLFVATSKDGNVWSQDQAKYLFRDLCNGLKYLHERKICHRDIKPDNLMLYFTGTLRIADFGCAVRFPEEVPYESCLLRDTEGTYAFYAPESVSAEGNPYSAFAADVWAAGVTLYTWIFGQVPFYYNDPESLFEAIRSSPLSFGEAIGVELSDLLARLMERSPKQRISLDDCLVHPWLADLPPIDTVDDAH